MSTLTVAGLWKGYSAAPVLRGVDLDVPAGSLTAVLGLSGCGKTTLLRVIAGFERAQEGRVSLGARTLDDGHTYVPPEHRGIGYVPQEGALFPHLTVRGNVGFGLTREERRGGAVGELLEMVGLAALAERYPHQLSGGEQQRVALARALARRPEVLLLDEPFSSLDASLRTRVREEVHTLLRAQGVTTVLVTHDQEEALSLADSVAVLREGTIVQGGTPDQLYTRPADVELARFLGAVNLIDADFEQGVARTALGALALRADPGAQSSSAPGAGRGVVMVRPEQLEVYSAAGDGFFGFGDQELGDEETAGGGDEAGGGEMAGGVGDEGAKPDGVEAQHAGGDVGEADDHHGHQLALRGDGDEGFDHQRGFGLADENVCGGAEGFGSAASHALGHYPSQSLYNDLHDTAVIGNGCEAGEEDDCGHDEESEVADVLGVAEKLAGGIGDDGAGLAGEIAEDDVSALVGEAEKRVDGFSDGDEECAVPDDDRAENQLEQDAPD